MAEEYKRCVEDELDWTSVEQLHAATLQISNSCYEYKKVCVSFLTAAVTAFITLNKNGINQNLFILASVVVLGFWLADATAYYYQRKLRLLIEKTKAQIANRNGVENKNLNRNLPKPSLQDLFNLSMTLYYVLLGMSCFGWLLYEFR
jgi:hypothetical protein